VSSPSFGAAETGGAEVSIYTLDGQLVFTDPHVADGAGFWDGRNFTERPVASGLYLVKVVLNGRHAVRTLAVVH
jgi:hypothetical protein